MRRRIRSGRPLGVAVALLALLGLAGAVGRAEVLLDLTSDPTAVSRGDDLTYEITIENTGPGTVSQATLYVPLPTGIDQLTAEVRVDGGPWEAYPANGLIPLDPLVALGTRFFEIRGAVELGAPGSLPTTAEVLSPPGPLAAAFLEINVLPSVDAGPDLIAEFGGSVEILGSSAGDGGEGIETILWDDGGAGGAFDDPSTLHPTYSPQAISGLVELTVTVIDRDGGSANDSLRVRVNDPPSVDAGPDRDGVGETSIALIDATASDTDGWIVAYVWDDGGAGGAFDPSATVLHPVYTLPEVDPCAGGAVELTLTVTDDWGGEASDGLTVVVAEPNRFPTVDAGADRTGEAGERVRLLGTASDPDDDLESVAWRQTGGVPVDLSGVGADVEFVAPAVEFEEVLEFTLRAVDACGVQVEETVSILVTPLPVVGDLGLEVTLRAVDPWGFPVNPLDPLRAGAEFELIVEARNTGDEALTGLGGRDGDGEPLAFSRTILNPWETARAEVPILVGANGGGGVFEISILVTAFGPDGTPMAVEKRIVFLMETVAGGLTLDKRVDASIAAVGETITYTYVLRNDGGTTITDLALVDDRLGPIDLPRTRLVAGESLTVTVDYVIRESDLPGPLTNTASASGFGVAGVGTEAASAVSLEVVSSGGGGAAARSDATSVRSIVISEVAWAGTRQAPRDEWIELANLSEAAVDLAGWTLRWQEGAEGPWRTIPLHGSIDPMPVALSDRVDSLHRLASVPEDQGWRVFDVSWWGLGKRGEEGRGFFLLERGNDDVVANVSADVVYDAAFDLPDAGTTLFLHALDGTIVDTANADAGGGWVAGDGLTGATMERVNPLRADEPGNWQTSPGILTYGTDAFGRRLVATAGKPNSPSLETLTAYAASEIPTTYVYQSTQIRLPDGGATSPTVRVTVSASGGGGSLGAGAPPIVTRRTGDGTWLEFDPARWPSGTVCVWIIDGEGDALLVALATEM